MAHARSRAGRLKLHIDEHPGRLRMGRTQNRPRTATDLQDGLGEVRGMRLYVTWTGKSADNRGKQAVPGAPARARYARRPRRHAPTPRFTSKRQIFEKRHERGRYSSLCTPTRCTVVVRVPGALRMYRAGRGGGAEEPSGLQHTRHHGGAKGGGSGQTRDVVPFCPVLHFERSIEIVRTSAGVDPVRGVGAAGRGVGFSGAPLSPPVVACALGYLYNKDAVIRFLLQVSPGTSVSSSDSSSDSSSGSSSSSDSSVSFFFFF